MTKRTIFVQHGRRALLWLGRGKHVLRERRGRRGGNGALAARVRSHGGRDDEGALLTRMTAGRHLIAR